MQISNNQQNTTPNFGNLHVVQGQNGVIRCIQNILKRECPDVFIGSNPGTHFSSLFIAAGTKESTPLDGKISEIINESECGKNFKYNQYAHIYGEANKNKDGNIEVLIPSDSSSHCPLGNYVYDKDGGLIDFKYCQAL